MDCTRYAIWWVPRPGTTLARFGAEWTGWCPDRGMGGARRALGVLSRPRAGVPGAGRLRGLHASLRAPFRLAPGRSVWALEDALADLAARTAPVQLPRLHVAVEDGRVVLAPMRRDEALSRLAAAVAEAVQPFAAADGVTADASAAAGREAAPPAGPRAPLGFRLALSDRLDPADAAVVAAELAPSLAPVLAGSQTIGDLALLCEPGRGRPWRLRERYALDDDGVQAPGRLPAGMDCRGPTLIAPLGGQAAA